MKFIIFFFILTILFIIYKLFKIFNKRKVCYIFGYGSLVNSKSRNKTSKTYAKPVVIDKNFEYIRSYEFDGLLGIKKETTPSKMNNINGVVFKVDRNQLNLFDIREKHYTRIKLPTKYVKSLSNYKINKNLPIYTYQPKLYLHKNRKKKIKKYLETVIIGFKEYGNKFLKQFFTTTENLPIKYS